MTDINRRDAVKILALVAAASGVNAACGAPDDHQTHPRTMRDRGTQPARTYRRQFFTDHEFATLTAITVMIIPADERSGSASDAGVPEFIDFVMTDELLGPVEPRQTAMRGGLAWLDHQCRERFGGKPFVECSVQEQEQMLDGIAFPSGAPPEMRAGVRFFSSVRDLTIAGFFSSQMGVEDLQYIGNVPLAEFPGCPSEVLEHIGVGRSGSA